MEDEGGKTAVALSFEGVLTRLRHPQEVTDRIQEWADYLGVASERPQHEVNGYCAKREIHIDFFPGPSAGKLRTLERAKNEMGLGANKHVFIGSSKRDEVIAEKAGWSYLDVTDAARDGGWELKPAKD